MPDLRQRAKDIYLESGGQIQIKELAEQLGLPPTTVSSWKNRDGWNAELKQTRIVERNAKRNATQDEIVYTKKGKPAKSPGLVGNKHAKGHGPGFGNKNALKHGLYETLKYSCFTEDEKLLMQSAPTNELEYYQQMIVECEVREKRMYTRLEELQSNLRSQYDDGMMPEGSVEMTMHSVGKMVTKTSRSIYTAIIATEEALTRIQDKKRAAVDGWTRAKRDLARLELDTMRYELEVKKFEQDIGIDAKGVTVVIAGEQELED